MRSMQRGPELGPRGPQLSLGTADRPSGWSTRPSTIPPCPLTMPWSRKTTPSSERRARPGAPAFRRHPRSRRKEADFVDSVPPGYFGGNVDNRRIGKGAAMYYPVAAGPLLLPRHLHANHANFDFSGTAIECSWPAPSN